VQENDDVGLHLAPALGRRTVPGRLSPANHIVNKQFLHGAMRARAETKGWDDE
jgi:hypothetical protein